MLPRMRALTWLAAAFNVLLAVAVITGVPLSGTAWFLGNGALAVLWMACLPRRRTCPQCGTGVPRALLVCTVCRHDSYRPLASRRQPRSTGHL